MTLLKWLVIAALVIALMAVVAGRVGWMSGRAPNDLGVKDGKLKRPSPTPNSVSSQARLWPEAAAFIEPLVVPAGLEGPQAVDQLARVVAGMEGGRVVEQRSDYLRAEFTTRLLRYVDDVEFWVDPATRAVQVRSASRVGRRDFGVNRARVEAIRAAFTR